MTGTGMLESGLPEPGTPGARSAGSGTSPCARRRVRPTGEMRFVFHTDDGPVATADKAWLRLDFGNYSADLRLRLLSGSMPTGARRRLHRHEANPGVDPGAVVGAVVGYFSGAGCALACGVEN